MQLDTCLWDAVYYCSRNSGTCELVWGTCSLCSGSRLGRGGLTETDQRAAMKEVTQLVSTCRLFLNVGSIQIWEPDFQILLAGTILVGRERCQHCISVLLVLTYIDTDLERNQNPNSFSFIHWTVFIRSKFVSFLLSAEKVFWIMS